GAGDDAAGTRWVMAANGNGGRGASGRAGDALAIQLHVRQFRNVPGTLCRYDATRIPDSETRERKNEMQQLAERPEMAVSESSVAELRAQVAGAVIMPGDVGYDEARAAWNLVIDQYPAVIVRVESAADVSAAVRFAGAQGLGVKVQATGHGASREADGAMLVLTAGLTELRIDAEAQTAWVGAGLMWGPVLAKAQEAGLAPLLGSSPGVGAVGYTLGGGVGWLARK